MRVNRVESLLTLYFSEEPVRDYASAQRASAPAYSRFFRTMLDEGVLLPPSPYETCFVSAAHTEADVEAFLRAAECALEGVRTAPSVFP